MVSVQFLMMLLPRGLANAAMIPIYSGVVAFLGAISYYGYQFATYNAHFSMPAVDFIMGSIIGRQVTGALSMYWVYMLIPAGCLILAAHFAVVIVHAIRITFQDESKD
jgi:TRAP-type C4-dicarboxylate transport system permease small subunit